MALSPASSRGGAGATAPLTLTGTNPASEQLIVAGAAAQASAILDVQETGNFQVLVVGGSGLGCAAIISAFRAGDIALALSPAGAGTADILEINSSTGFTLSGFNKGGYFFTNKVSAPADDALANSQVMLWLDDTAGAASTKLMVKAKDVAGTVRTAAVVLT